MKKRTEGVTMKSADEKEKAKAARLRRAAKAESLRQLLMLTVLEAAGVTGLKPVTLYQRIKENHPDLPPYYRFGSSSSRRCVIRFKRSDLEQWLEKHRVEPKSA